MQLAQSAAIIKLKEFEDKNTLYRKPEVLKTIESGRRNLEDFYLDIVDIVKRKELTGF